MFSSFLAFANLPKSVAAKPSDKFPKRAAFSQIMLKPTRETLDKKKFCEYNISDCSKNRE